MASQGSSPAPSGKKTGNAAPTQTSVDGSAKSVPRPKREAAQRSQTAASSPPADQIDLPGYYLG